jgi:hypothetical protein
MSRPGRPDRGVSDDFVGLLFLRIDQGAHWLGQIGDFRGPNCERGVSDKVLTMALSCLLLGAPAKLRLWHEVGASMVAIDTLVHNFLHRTGILHRFGADHAYGSGCYRRCGCPRSFKPWPNESTPAPSTQRSPRCFPGSSSTRSGGTAPGAASISATATALMIERLVQMFTVKFIVFAIELRFIINRLSV